jgi:hypothetical protein
MVLLQWLVHLNGGGSSGATTWVREMTVVRKSGQGGGGFSGSYIEPRAPAYANNRPESSLHPNQISLEDANVKSLSYLIFSQLRLIWF